MVSRVHERNDKHTCVSEYKTLLPNLEKLVDEMNIFICPSIIIDDNGINVFDSFALEEIENSMQFKLVNTKEFDNDVLHKYTLLSSPGI